MAKEITKGGITYNSYKNAGVSTDQWPFILTNQEGPDSEGGIINAVDIDWNGAEITSTAFPAMDRTINTTGDLLSWIKDGIEEAAVSERTSGVVRRSLWIN